MANFRSSFSAILLYVLCCTASVMADEFKSTKKSVRLEVIDSFAQLHKGPGSSYPIFYVVEQGETILVLTRRPGWYQVRTDRGEIGWVPASEIARTLQESGEPADLPSISFGDYLKNRWSVGFDTGIFASGELEDAETISANFGYKPLSWLGIEIEAGQFFGDDVRGDQISLNIAVEPFSKWRVSPALFIGRGRTSVEVQPRLEPLAFDEGDHDLYGLRLNYYLGRNFVIRGEHRWLSISADEGSEDLRKWNLGFNTFF